MDAEQIRSLQPRLQAFLKLFAGCFKRSDTRGHLAVYVEGQMSDLPRKNCEPIADARNMPPRTLQQFLSLLDWDHDLMRVVLQQLVAAEHGDPHSIGLLDETGCPKKGGKTPGVQRQWCGATGKQDNCVVTVHLGYAAEDFHCLLDSELFLPESWSNDRPRCQAADIPDEMVPRPKTDIALELYDRSRANGVEFDWLTFDEGYGKSVAFLDALRARQQKFIAEVPVLCHGWIDPPRTTKRRRSRFGAPPLRPRLVKDSAPSQSVRELLEQSPALRDQAWQAWNVKEGAKGPMVWEIKHAWFYPRGVDDLPQAGAHLLIARNVLEPEKLKYFVAHAPRETSPGLLLKVAFSRWRIERCFEDEKTELGFDHFEGRSYVGLMRHQIITAVTHLFLARTLAAWQGEKIRVDSLPGPHRRRRTGEIPPRHRPHLDRHARTCRATHPRNPTPQRRLPPQPPQTHPRATP